MSDLRTDPDLRARFVSLVSGSIPRKVEASSVAIVRGNHPVVEQIGSGTLCVVADRHFIATATHVVEEARRMGAGMGISNAEEGFVALDGEWSASVPASTGDRDTTDVAVYPLNEKQLDRLKGKYFVRLADVDFSVDLEPGYFVILGYPRMLGQPSVSDGEKLQLGVMQYGTVFFAGDATGLAGYDPRYHLLLDASEQDLYDHSGNEMVMRGAHGIRVPFPSGLKGISGCGIWRLGKSSKPVRAWTENDCVLVGVQTSLYERRGAIKGTRWRFVTTLLAGRFPELTNAMRLHEVR